MQDSGSDFVNTASVYNRKMRFLKKSPEGFLKKTHKEPLEEIPKELLGEVPFLRTLGGILRETDRETLARIFGVKHGQMSGDTSTTG